MASNIFFILLTMSLVLYAGGVVRALARRRAAPDDRPAPTWDAGHALCAFGLFMVFSAASNVAATLAARSIGFAPKTPELLARTTPEALALAVTFIYAFNVPTLLVITRFAGEKGEAGRALGFGTPIIASLRPAAVAFFVFVPFQAAFPSVVDVLWTEILHLPLTHQAVLEMILEARWLPTVAMVFSAAVLAPVFEEIIFRAFIQKGIEKSLGRTPAILVTSVVFAAVHVDPLIMIKLFPLALALSIAYDRSRNIVANILFHMAFNFTSLVGALVIKQAGLDLAM